MKRLVFSFAAIMFAVSVANMAIAQPPEGRGPRQGGPEGGPRGQDGPRRGPGGPGGPGGPPPNPILEALDANGDREISAEEIKNAAAALAKLDKNSDGKLTFDELRPQFARGRGGPGRGGPGAGPRPDGEGGPRGRGPGREGGPEARGEGDRPDPAQFIARLMNFDKDKDGKISKEELPERMQGILERADANKDGALDKKELAQMAERFGQRGRPARGAGDGEGDRPARPRRPTED